MSASSGCRQRIHVSALVPAREPLAYQSSHRSVHSYNPYKAVMSRPDYAKGVPNAQSVSRAFRP